MSTYSFDDLQGAGTGSQDLTAGTPYTFNLTNNSGSSYFTMETPRNFDGVTPRNLSGSITSASSGVVFNQSDYIAGFALPTGNNSFVFTPSTNVTGSTLKLRGTGGIYVELSGSGGSVATEFIMLVKTDNAGTSASDQFTIPTTGTGYNYDVDWGDGNTSTGVTGTTTHTFTGGAGTYTIKISGAFPRIYFSNGGDKLKLLEVQNWGNIVWGSDFRNAFFGCSNMNITATDSPDLSNTTLISAFLYNCISLDADLGSWDVSNCTSMGAMFQGTTIYQGQGLENWDVSNVTDMGSMFRLSNFDNNIGNWQLNSGLTTMDSIFRSGAFPSSANYTDSIVGWANYVFTNGAPFSVDMANQFGKTFDTSRSGGANFADAGAARTYLTTTAGWTISSDTVI